MTSDRPSIQAGFAPLRRAPETHQPEGPLVVIVLDGVGVGRGDEWDAVAAATTPTLDRLAAAGLSRTLRAHGPAVGLASESDMGNSEVGHNTLGAGRIFDQGANQVDKAIRTGRIWEGDWQALVEAVRANHSTLHLIGLLSDGNVHSSMEHLAAVLERAAEDGVATIRVHVLLDGRDVPDFSALVYVDQLEARLDALRERGVDAAIASGGGRMVTTMDRYGANWSVVEAGWRAHVLGTAPAFPSARAAIESARASDPGISDQDLPAFTVVGPDSEPVGRIEDGNAVLVFNFRGDRAIEISEALTAGEDFDHFDRVRVPRVEFAAMSLYDSERGFPEHYLVRPEQVPGTVSELLAAAGVAQFACAETQKFGHVTYFWNGNRSEKFDPSHETYLEIPSDQVPFQTRPEMKAAETADALVAAIAENRYGFLRANFAGGDMVGHTADFEATVRSLEAIDEALGRIDRAVAGAKGCILVTADHGNAEDMVQRGSDGSVLHDKDGAVMMKTSHSLNPVRCLIMDYAHRPMALRTDLPDAGLADVAATITELLGFEAPENYEPSILTWS